VDCAGVMLWPSDLQPANERAVRPVQRRALASLPSLGEYGETSSEQKNRTGIH
jgi:hypothetical protein